MPRSAGSRHRVRPDRRSTPHRPPTAGLAPTFAPSPVYRPRRPAETPLYRVVQHHLNTFLARAEADEIRPVPRWTEREFRQYLTCGILAYGFARARCGGCHQGRQVAFSCKGRGDCPSCGERTVHGLPVELVQRLARLIPLPRIHRHRDHGVFAPTSRCRPEATASTVRNPYLGVSGCVGKEDSPTQGREIGLVSVGDVLVLVSDGSSRISLDLAYSLSDHILV